MVSKVETRIGIPTSQARVWEVLADLEGWPRWNPFLVEVQGKLSIGALTAFGYEMLLASRGVRRRKRLSALSY